MHVVVVGCGRVGSGLARSAGGAAATRSRSIDRRSKAFDRLPEGFTGTHASSASASTATASTRRASRRPARWPPSPTATTPTSSWPASPARPSASTDVVARIYDPRRAAIYERLGIPTIATVQWATERVLPAHPPRVAHVRVDRPQRQGRAWSSGRCPPPGPASTVADLDVAGHGPGRRPHPARRRRTSPAPDLSLPGGRRRLRGVDGDADRRSSTSTSAGPTAGGALMRVVIAGGGNVGTFIADDLAKAGHEVVDRRGRRRPRRRGPAQRRAARASRGSPPTPARSPSSPGPASTRPTSSPPSPATTRTTS